MTTLLKPILLSAAVCCTLAVPAIADERIDPERFTVTLPHADLHPATQRAALHTLRRIEDAALTVCGAPSSSLGIVKLAVRRSACWKDAVAGAMSGVDDPLLAQAYREQHRS